MVGTVAIILEPVLFTFDESHIIAYVLMGIMSFTTVFSGIDYMRAYLPYIDTNS